MLEFGTLVGRYSLASLLNMNVNELLVIDTRLKHSLFRIRGMVVAASFFDSAVQTAELHGTKHY